MRRRGFVRELGDAVVGSVIRPGDDLWVRVPTDAWPRRAEVARCARLGCTYFDFLSGHRLDAVAVRAHAAR